MISSIGVEVENGAAAGEACGRYAECLDEPGLEIDLRAGARDDHDGPIGELRLECRDRLGIEGERRPRDAACIGQSYPLGLGEAQNRIEAFKPSYGEDFFSGDAFSFELLGVHVDAEGTGDEEGSVHSKEPQQTLGNLPVIMGDKRLHGPRADERLRIPS